MPTFQDDPVISKDSDSAAIVGESTSWHGVFGKSGSGFGVSGESQGTGVSGVSQTWFGVYGETHGAAAAVMGEGKDKGDGVKGHANGPGKAAVAGFHLSNRGPGIFGRGNPAGQFEGNVVVTGDLILTGGDVAEQFDVAEHANEADEVCPGAVVILDGDGALVPCTQAYDTCVAGVVSGAGDRVPAVVLDRREPAPADGGTRRSAVSVVGKAWCRADASHAPIRVGSLLTTSSTPGHAMAATDRESAFGSVIGKALTPLAAGTGLVLVLVGLG